MVSEVLILGGGLAGATAALELAREGIAVRLVERDSGPSHKICGEFLSIEAQRDLARLGVDLAGLGAVPIDRVRLAHGKLLVEGRLGFTAQGVSRLVLDEALLEAAVSHGARIERGVKVQRIDAGEIATSAGTLRAGRILLATGKHDVRGAKRGAGMAGHDFVGFKTHWRLSPRQRAEVGNAVELVLFDGGYAGMQRVAGDVLNFCLVLRRGRLADLGGTWDAVLGELLREEHVARRIGDAAPLFDRPMTIASLPYGYVCDGRAGPADGLFRLGDQAAVTAPLTGDGMAIAVRSARLAVASLKGGASASCYQAKVAQAVAPQVRWAMLLQKAAGMPAALPYAMAVMGVWPGLLGRLAGMTRLPGGTLQ